MTSPTLAVALDAIMDALLAKLQAANVPGGTLSDVATIARGDRSGPCADPPAIYISPRAMRAVQGTAKREWWTLPVVAGVMVYHENDAEGYQNATDLAARARKIMLNRLGLSYAKKPYSGEFIPSAPGMREDEYFRALAEVRVEFEVEEAE